MTTLIKNAHIVTQNAKREILKGDILVVEGKIAAIGKVKDSADQEIDAKGDVVMPGLINTHSHVAMATMKAKIQFSQVRFSHCCHSGRRRS